jgi:CheY-like chemotaxis protein
MARILVIDDDESVRMVVRQMLNRAGHKVAEAPDGQVGVAHFQTLRPDLVITDIIMPNQEGIETIMHLRRLDPLIRIIAMSGGGRTGNKDFLAMAEKLGASGVIAKPFRSAELIDIVTRVLEGEVSPLSNLV